jgi:uncharacterized membrane protein
LKVRVPNPTVRFRPIADICLAEPILGIKKLDFRRGDSSQLLATRHHRGTDWPLLVVRNHGRGRTVAWVTDIGPHWLP